MHEEKDIIAIILIELFKSKLVDYDCIYNFIGGWIAYAKQAGTYLLRQRILNRFEQDFSGEVSAKEVGRKKIYFLLIQ